MKLRTSSEKGGGQLYNKIFYQSEVWTCAYIRLGLQESEPSLHIQNSYVHITLENREIDIFDKINYFSKNLRTGVQNLVPNSYGTRILLVSSLGGDPFTVLFSHVVES